MNYNELSELIKQTAINQENANKAWEKRWERSEERWKRSEEKWEKSEGRWEKSEEKWKELRNQTKENQKNWEKRWEKLENQRKENQKDWEKECKESGKRWKEIKENLYGMGITQGNISENLIEANFKPAMKKIGKDIKKVHRNIRRGKLEFDLLGINSTEIFVGETKTRLTKQHIDKFLQKQLPKFKECFPKYNKYKMYGVVGGRIITEKSLNYALSNGLFVIKETYNGNAEVIHKNDFKPKEFIFNNLKK